MSARSRPVPNLFWLIIASSVLGSWMMIYGSFLWATRRPRPLAPHETPRGFLAPIWDPFSFRGVLSWLSQPLVLCGVLIQVLAVCFTIAYIRRLTAKERDKRSGRVRQ